MALNIVERPAEEKDTLVYRYPLLNDTLAIGTTIRVGVGQAAILAKDNKVFDVFPHGDHVLSLETMPYFAKYYGIKNNSSFACDVYFVSLSTYEDLKWATVHNLILRDLTFGSVPIKASGNFSFRIFNVQLFMNSLFGKITTFDSEDVSMYLRTMAINGLTDMLTSTRITALDFYTNYPKFALQNYREIINKFNSCGLLLVSFEVEDVVIPEETEQLLKVKILEHANLTPEDVVSGKVISDGSNVIQMQNGLPINHPVNAGTLMSSEMKRMFNMVQDLTVTCVHCGATIAKNFKFCPQCGKENKETVKECPNCHNIVAFKAKFCPDCGTELFDKDSVIICNNCGRLIKEHEKYCPDCGKPV